MTSADYKERFFAEYHQTRIRYEKLRLMCSRYEAGKGDFYQEYVTNGGEQNTYFDTESAEFGSGKGIMNALETKTGLSKILKAKIVSKSLRTLCRILLAHSGIIFGTGLVKNSAAAAVANTATVFLWSLIRHLWSLWTICATNPEDLGIDPLASAAKFGTRSRTESGIAVIRKAKLWTSLSKVYPVRSSCLWRRLIPEQGTLILLTVNTSMWM